MTKKRRHIPGWILSVLIPLGIAVIVCAAILITNIFIPVRYLSAYIVSSHANAEGELRVTFIDVGFGDSALVEFPDGKNMLIDGGDGEYPHELALLKLLNSHGVDTIDFLVCTSVKDEHCGGLIEVVKYKDVRKAFIPYCTNPRITEKFFTFVSQLEKKGVEYDYACYGGGYSEDNYGSFFTFLSPTDWKSGESEYMDMSSDPTDVNIDNASVVTWVEYMGKAFAFTSDVGHDTLEKICEEYVLYSALGDKFCPIGDRCVVLENCSVATVPAHGAEDNTYLGWYDLLKPDYAVLSIGENFAGLPSKENLADVCAYATPAYTSERGNISFKVTAEGIFAL